MIILLNYRPASIVDFNMTLLPLMPNIDTDQAVILEEKKLLKRDDNTNSIMVRTVTALYGSMGCRVFKRGVQN